MKVIIFIQFKFSYEFPNKIWELDKDCDIYVAVDKQVGICYIIPMSWADSLDYNQCKNVKLSEITKYKENWNIIKEMTVKM